MSLLFLLCAVVFVYTNYSKLFQHDTQVISRHEEIAAAEDVVQPDGVDSYTLETVSQHNSENDCWVALGGKVYDVTEFIKDHPGGKAILEGCGTDGTELYEIRPMGSGTPHSDRARNLVEKFFIGDLVE